MNEDLAPLLIGEPDDVVARDPATTRIRAASKRYCELTRRVGGAVGFATETVFPVGDDIRFAGETGELDVSVVFSPGTGKYSVAEQLRTYHDQLPQYYIPFASIYGGNLLCVDPEGQVRFWDHESFEGESCSVVSESLERFFDSLSSKKDEHDELENLSDVDIEDDEWYD